MIRTVADKLVATVIEVNDLGKVYPVLAFKERIGLDVRIERGSLAIGKEVRLLGPCSEEELKIVGIEMLSNVHDANVVRIFCSRPKLLTLPAGKVDGWVIAEP